VRHCKIAPPMTLWVKGNHKAFSAICPLSRRKRTPHRHGSMSRSAISGPSGIIPIVRFTSESSCPIDCTHTQSLPTRICLRGSTCHQSTASVGKWRLCDPSTIALLSHIPWIGIGACKRYVKNGPVELYSPNCDLGSTEWPKTSVRRAGVYAGACDINVKATSDRRTIATAKIAEDALGASTSLFRLKLAASESLLEAPAGLPSKLTAAIP
jgi:hypothetical protein